MASPLIRLTNKLNATIEDIGTPEDLIASLGPFVTGNTLDPDELLETSVEKRDGQTVCLYQNNDKLRKTMVLFQVRKIMSI